MMLDLGRAPAGREPPLQAARLHALYRELLAPLEPQLRGLQSLIAATDGPLAGELPGISKPALAMAANQNPAESPLLELDDVLGLRLNARWVLLSACNTAAS
ncbi:MAG: hypothetical protein IV097_24465 [Burkholderiaceae bacterium]|nr:hypothetical protein [Burkholderiaceae bacterium]